MFPADGKYKDVLKAYKKLFNKINLWNVQELGIRTKDKLIVQTSFSFLISTKRHLKKHLILIELIVVVASGETWGFLISSFLHLSLLDFFPIFFPLFIVHCSFLSSHSHIFVHVASTPSIVSLVCGGLQRL